MIAYLVSDMKAVGTTIQGLTACAGLRNRGFEVELLVVRRSGALSHRAPTGVRVVDLSEGRRAGRSGSVFEFARALGALTHYLRERRPEVLWSGAKTTNLLALAARRLAREGAEPARVVLTMTNDLHHRARPGDSGRWLTPLALRACYGRADRVVTLSSAMTKCLVREEGFRPELLETIPPPIDLERISRLGRERLDHPWLRPGEPPVVLSVARLASQKSPETLLEAFALVSCVREMRLIWVGDGTARQRQELEELARKRGIATRCDFVGFDANPYKFMTRARLLAVSSAWEGFCIVVAEALACGCPVVATDCPYGPGEILDHGKLGRLVPVAAPREMAEAILEELDVPIDRKLLVARAEDFAVPKIVERYASLLSRLGVPSTEGAERALSLSARGSGAATP